MFKSDQNQNTALEHGDTLTLLFTHSVKQTLNKTTKQLNVSHNVFCEMFTLVAWFFVNTGLKQI